MERWKYVVFEPALSIDVRSVRVCFQKCFEVSTHYRCIASVEVIGDEMGEGAFGVEEGLIFGSRRGSSFGRFGNQVDCLRRRFARLTIRFENERDDRSALGEVLVLADFRSLC